MLKLPLLPPHRAGLTEGFASIPIGRSFRNGDKYFAWSVECDSDRELRYEKSKGEPSRVLRPGESTTVRIPVPPKRRPSDLPPVDWRYLSPL